MHNTTNPTNTNFFLLLTDCMYTLSLTCSSIGKMLSFCKAGSAKNKTGIKYKNMFYIILPS